MNDGAYRVAAVVEVLAMAAEEGEKTRRHFDVMAEKVHDAVRIVAEAAAHHTTVLDEHQRRLTRMERDRSA